MLMGLIRHWKLAGVGFGLIALILTMGLNRQMVHQRALLTAQLEEAVKLAHHWQQQTRIITRAYEAHNKKALADEQQRRDYEAKQNEMVAYIKQLEEDHDDHICLFPSDVERLHPFWNN